MKEFKKEIAYRFVQIEELDKEDTELVELAKKATRHAYAPYSHFSVGAALRLADGTTVIGANQENAAYPSGLCAERTAIFAAQAQHPELAITTLVIAACNEKNFTENPISPCGACRQVMLEIEERYHTDLRVLLYGMNGIYIINNVRDLLPFGFEDSSMH